MTVAARHVCACCGGTGYVVTLPEAEVEAIAAGLREACRAAGMRVTGDDRVEESTAAALIGRTTKTLRNWRYTHRPIPFVERCRRISYGIPDLARWMHESSHRPD